MTEITQTPDDKTPEAQMAPEQTNAINKINYAVLSAVGSGTAFLIGRICAEYHEVFPGIACATTGAALAVATIHFLGAATEAVKRIPSPSRSENAPTALPAPRNEV